MSAQQKAPDQVATDAGPKTEQLNSAKNYSKAQPPFANQLQGQSRVLLFVAGHACWSAARGNLQLGRDAVALPVGMEPAARNWRCVAGKSVVVFELDDTSPGYRAALVRHLAAWGAAEVALVPSDCNPAKAVFWGV